MNAVHESQGRYQPQSYAKRVEIERQ